MNRVDKKNEGRFTLQFTMTDPAHLQAVEILNRLRPRSKAPYLVEAILHYDNCTETPAIRRVPALDEKAIEAIVRRVLEKTPLTKNDSVVNNPTVTREKPDRISGDVDLDDAISAFGAENIQSILGAVKAFRG